MRHNYKLMRIKNVFILTFLLMIVHVKQYGHDIVTNWKLAKQSEDIEISYRNVKVGDTLKTRQMRMTFTVSSDTETLIDMFKDSEKLSAWTAGAEKCKVLNDETDSTWMTYTLYNIPWPFEQKDLITRYNLIETESATIINLSSVPQLLPSYEGVSRLEKFEGYWKFTELSNGNTEVEFVTISFTKPIVPRFIQDPIIQRVLINSVNELKSIVKQQYLAEANKL